MVAKVESTKGIRLLKRSSRVTGNDRVVGRNGHKQDARYPDGARAALLIDDPFYYGWRTVIETGPDGKQIINQVPLQQADFLDPQLGDQMVQSDLHFQNVKSMYDPFENRYLNDPTTAVMSDVKMRWGIPGLQEPAPDLAVIPNMTTKGEHHSSFDVVAEGTLPCLVVEVVSPKYAGDDTVKVDIYERAGIQEYIIFDPSFDDENEPAELIGYRLVNGIYQLMQPDAQGRLYSATTDVWFGLDERQRELILTDGTTGTRLLDNRGEHTGRILAEQRADEEAQRADEEVRRADEEAQRADEEAQRAAKETQRADKAEAEAARLRALLAQASAKNNPK